MAFYELSRQFGKSRGEKKVLEKALKKSSAAASMENLIFPDD